MAIDINFTIKATDGQQYEDKKQQTVMSSNLHVLIYVYIQFFESFYIEFPYLVCFVYQRI